MITFLQIISIATLWSEFIDATVYYPNARILNDGHIIPAIGFGTFIPIAEENHMKQAIIDAIKSGFRLINTAGLYDNGAIVGNAINNAIKNGIISRDELFITAELDMTVNTTQDVVPALENALNKLQLSYIDLYLMRLPLRTTITEESNILIIWRGMEIAKGLGLTNSIGVSNFNSSHINKILAHSKIRPAVNQFEVNPTSAKLELVAYCQQQYIKVMADAPFGFVVPRSFANVSTSLTGEEMTLKSLSDVYGKTSYQILLRYLIDRGIIPIPGSIKPEHIQANIDVFDFRLTQEEIYIINEFNRNEEVYPINDVKVDNDISTYINENTQNASNK